MNETNWQKEPEEKRNTVFLEIVVTVFLALVFSFFLIKFLFF